MSKTELIEAVGVTKSFKTAAGELRVLKGIDLSIRKGEMLGIIGASGAGKSTLLQILGALDRPTSGRVMFKEKDIASMDENSLARLRNASIGFVFQFHHLLPEFNSLENVMFPAIISGTSFPEAEKKANALLGELGLSGRTRHRPGELSGGEQQRVAVARALIQSPEVVLADEPTGNLDSATGALVLELLLKLNRQEGATLVLVTHDPELSRRTDRVIRLRDGRIVDEVVLSAVNR
jgi:lipoprotein-releasing system ATP-binding protein